MDKYKLKWRIFSFMLVFCVLLLVVLWLFQTVLLTDMYKFIRKREIESAIIVVEQNIDNPNLQTVFHELELDKEILIMPSQEFIQPPQRLDRYSRDRREPEAITKTAEFTNQDGRTISLTFYAMITPVDATVSTLRVQLYFITGIMILLAVGLAFIISKRISRPIEEINKGAKLLAAGSYDIKFAAKGFLEIKELTDTLNTTAVELSKVDSLRRELMANISHDLRTPLALIYSYAEMMQDFPDEITSEQTQIIMDETKRLTSLVNDILNVSQLEAGTMVLYKSVFNLTESIGAIIDRVSELLKKDGYSLVFERDGDVLVDADEVKITQAFYNLLVNAINYGGSDKKVLVRQIVSESHVKIEVIDNGDGITPENLPNIWERYYKEDKKHKRTITGTGLGLSIVKKIIELHGGACGVESELGKGSVFWFEIMNI